MKDVLEKFLKLFGNEFKEGFLKFIFVGISREISEKYHGRISEVIQAKK